ncbi:SNF2 domain-containing protein/helicase domain-containing protein [Abeliophyllum distichum]|uniref:SNF2 domain-containing protein/helicase domain-containing protein n=1 Tax=Abeliophyllum distichum TaxID=126358 RepID=A0ABD1P9S1_9LAMI
MGIATDSNYATPFPKRFPASSSSDLRPSGWKRMKVDERSGYNDTAFSAGWRGESDLESQEACSKVVDYSDPFSINNLLKELDSGQYGSVTKDIEDLLVQKKNLLDSYYAMDPILPFKCLVVQNNEASELSGATTSNVINLEDDPDGCNVVVKRFVPAAQLVPSPGPVVILDSDDEDVKDEKPLCPFQEVELKKPPGHLLMKDFLEQNYAQSRSLTVKDACLAGETELGKDKGVYVGTEDDMEVEEDDEPPDTSSDGLDDIWKEMTDTDADLPPDEREAEGGEDCEHSFILKDDIGEVCRICGVIGRGIETIIEYNFSKVTRNTRTYRYDGRSSKDMDQTEILPDGFKPSATEFTVADIYPHPRHKRMMKPHQIEGFNFLLSNLVTDNPGGCIMAHAPGSGKTFMIISFLQSFMAKYPFARPLVVLPRGILAIWKKEFIRWQVEDLPLYDFYSVKADSRSQQLEVSEGVGKREEHTLFGDTGKIPAACQEILLTCPSILILDEGHTPRNQDTDVLTSLEKVQTLRKVVLSGTLYQNHVKEVFNILNLVRPRFLKLETSKIIKRRILSRAEISSRRSLMKKDENRARKVNVIQDLRELTRKVLHYYKGDNLDELPGLVDFAVFLQLSPWQKVEVRELKNLARKFKINAEGSAIYVHPQLKTLSKNSGVKDRVDEEKIDGILEKLDEREGVKAKFYLNLLQLCESCGEKLLVFSQYLLPLKFLERLTVKMKGYRLGNEMFMITGDSDSETRESSMERFNTSPDARVFFGSIKACGEGISLVGASRIIILDIHLNPSITRQAIGRAFRPGQLKKVYAYRLIASGSPEEEDHKTCFKKESIAKMWFEWDEHSGRQNFEMETLDVKECGDLFLETPRLREDIVALFQR